MDMSQPAAKATRHYSGTENKPLMTTERLDGDECPDDIEQDLSDIAVDELGGRKRDLPRRSGLVVAWMALSYPVLFAALCILLFGLGRIWLQAVNENTVASQRLQQLLALPTETVTFEPQSLFSEFPGPESDAAWYGLLGPSNGFISLPNPEQYGLAHAGLPDQKNPEHQIFGITMFHQLHCLVMIREVYYGLLFGKYNASDYSPDRSPEDEVSDFVYWVEHLQHCFDFLQQSIRCSGAMDIEKPHRDSPDASTVRRGLDVGGGTIDGYGSPHVCRSWDAAQEIMEEFKFDKPPHQHHPA